MNFRQRLPSKTAFRGPKEQVGGQFGGIRADLAFDTRMPIAIWTDLSQDQLVESIVRRDQSPQAR